MKSVKISELRNRLSHWLRLVRRGESVLVCDRERPIARIEPVGTGGGPADERQWLAELELRGTLRRPEQPLPAGWLERRPQVAADVVGALLAERDEGR